MVCTTSGNIGYLLEFKIPSANTRNLLEFNCFSWKLCILDRWLFSCGPVIGKLASTVY